jgi:5-methylcytosine-specific restriction protein B
VMVIEEINRGNPARSLGEMLTLIEASKRSPEHAMNLTYVQKRDDEGGVWLPPNLHVVGTMNIADRSLALVDLALRRRFSFITLDPQLNEAWMRWTASRIRTFRGDAGAFVRASTSSTSRSARIPPWVPTS